MGLQKCRICHFCRPLPHAFLARWSFGQKKTLLWSWAEKTLSPNFVGVFTCFPWKILFDSFTNDYLVMNHRKFNFSLDLRGKYPYFFSCWHNHLHCLHSTAPVWSGPDAVPLLSHSGSLRSHTLLCEIMT